MEKKRRTAPGLTRQFLTRLLRLSFSIPTFLAKVLFSIAGWGKRQLDKLISLKQRSYLRRVIFKTDTPEGKKFDTILILLIFASVIAVILETISEFHKSNWWIFFILEWLFTLIFTVEYILRLYSARHPVRYATSFFGMVDLLSILPTYISVFFMGTQHLLIVRALRLLRIFRIFKMGHFVSEGAVVLSALQASRTKIYVFVSFVVLMAIIIGSLMYMVESPHNPAFSNIPAGIYWAIVTLTTVGYGDITPLTTFGKFLATLVMILGYGVIAVPTGIVTAEISGRVMNLKDVVFKECARCRQTEHHTGAVYCHRCGSKL
ncbi:MAG: ion transporter [Lewinellaceae bacterium]|nr:ion transporter [Saprospiraceae bacterium]MCB9315633.1 ion transporter [Lewinellaceae bacterium]MCB9332087.1 ion transporter [Lewinellaceae bacterium]